MKDANYSDFQIIHKFDENALTIAKIDDLVAGIGAGNQVPSSPLTKTEQQADFESMLLLGFNPKFKEEVEKLREQYSVDSKDLEKNKALLGDSYFVLDIETMAEKINLMGNWFENLALHVLHIQQISAGSSLYKKYIEGRIVETDAGKGVELRLHGNISVADLKTAGASITNLVKEALDFKPRASYDGYDLGVALEVFTMKQNGSSYQEIFETMKERKVAIFEDKQGVIKVYKRVKSRMDSIYA